MTFQIAYVDEAGVHTVAQSNDYPRAEARCLSEAPPSGLTMHIYDTRKNDALVAVITPDRVVTYQ